MTPGSVEKTTPSIEAGHRSDREPALRSYAARYPAGTGEREHRHPGWHQLVYAAEGCFAVHTPSAHWVVPPDRGVWLPDGTAHQLTTRSCSLLHTLYVNAKPHCTLPGLRPLPEAAHVVRVSPLVRELISLVIAKGSLQHGNTADDHVRFVLLDQLRSLPVSPLDLPHPSGRLARDAADLLRHDPALTITEVARLVGASRRTLERSFATGVGLPLGRWRRRAQTLRALELLADGTSVTSTGVAVGYSTTSAFVAAFRAELGSPPGRYFERT